MNWRFWCCALTTLLSAAVSSGFSLHALFGSGAGNILAGYAASRSVALLLTILLAICARSRLAIAYLGILMAIVQAFDSIIGGLVHDASKTYGPLAFAVINAVAAGLLLRQGVSSKTETQ
jgi:hypothetical protein